MVEHRTENATKGPSLEASDQQLITEFQCTGSKECLEELVTRHIATVRNLAFRISLCSMAADDITQEVFIRVIRNIASFRKDAQFSTWLHRITVNTTRTHLDRGARTQSLENTDESMFVGSAAGPDQLRIQSELTDATHNALARLPPKLRTAIVLTSMEGLSAQEAARVEACTLPTMYWRIHKARKLLKGWLKRELEP
jgi:RNA polymerase sigma-70 factor (ECF subfamily)